MFQEKGFYRKLSGIGGGGYRCFCCGPQGGHNKKIYARKFRDRLKRYIRKIAKG